MTGLQIRCPHCGQRVDLTEETSLSDISCSACGSHFSVVDETSVAEQKPVFGRIGGFDILEKLGCGASGTVWRGKDLQLDRWVAIKIPRKERLDPTEAAKFIREARAAAQLRHPNIVTVHEVGREEELIYIVSDLVEGNSLSEWSSVKNLTPTEAAELCRKLAEALEHAHAAGVIHRDIKPQNIMVDAKGEPYLSDFGLARQETSEATVTLDGHLLGTPAYMSPEQARGEGHSADARSDIYSLGVVLFNLLTGELPFRGSLRMLVQQVINDEPPSPRRLSSHVPKDLETICLKCLEKEPGKRYQKARDLADDLSRFLKGEPILAHPVGQTVRLWRWAKRKPALAALSLAVALALLSVAVVSTTAAMRISAERDKKDVENYFANIALANRHIQEGNIDQAKQALWKCPERFRNWEWGHLLHKCHQAMVTIASTETNLYLDVYSQKPSPQQGLEILSMNFSPDGRYVAALDATGMTSVWEWQAKRRLFTCGNATNPVHCFAFSPVGGLFAASIGTNCVCVWATDSWAERVRIVGMRTNATALVFAPEPGWLLTGGADGEVVGWNPSTGVSVRRFVGAGASMQSLLLSPDGRKLIAQTEAEAWVWDLVTGGQIDHFAAPSGQSSKVFASCSGTEFVTVDSANRPSLWRSGEEQQTLITLQSRWMQLRRQVVFSPDGKKFCNSGEDGSARVWNTGTGDELFSLGDDVHLAAFSPDGRVLATTRRDPNPLITLWDLVEQRELKTLAGHESLVNTLTFSPDGLVLASGDQDGAIKLWTASPGREVLQDENWVWGTRYSPDDRYVVMAPWFGGVTLWDADSGRKVLTLKMPMWAATGAAFLPDGRHLVTGGTHFVARLWDLKTGRRIRSFIGHEAAIVWLDVTLDGKVLATNSEDGTLRLWEIESGREMHVFRGLSSNDWFSDVSHDGRHVLTVSSNYVVAVREIVSGRVVREFVTGESWILKGTFSPDGRQVATVGWDGLLRLWEIDSGRELSQWPIRGHGLGVVFSADGSRLITTSARWPWYGNDLPSYVLWEVPGGRRVCDLQGPREVGWAMDFTKDGRRLVCNSTDLTSRQLETLPWRIADYAEFSGETLAEKVEACAEDQWLARFLKESDSVLDDRRSERIITAPFEESLIPPRSEKATPNQLDLSAHYTSPLGSGFYPSGYFSASSDCLPKSLIGLKELDGILFDLRGLAMLRPSTNNLDRPEAVMWSEAPSELAGLRTPPTFQRIHLLHAVLGNAPAETPVAELIFHALDGTQQGVALSYGTHIGSYEGRTEDGLVLRNARVVWRGTNWTTLGLDEQERKAGKQPYSPHIRRLWLTSIANPIPGKQIASVDYRSLNTTWPPFLVAGTLE